MYGYVRDKIEQHKLKCAYSQGVYDGLCCAVIMVAALLAFGVAAIWMVHHG